MKKMLKKNTAIITAAAAMVSSFCMPSAVFAADKTAPFELGVPEFVNAEFIGIEGPNSVLTPFSQDPDTLKIVEGLDLQNAEAMTALRKAGYDNAEMYVQIDWSIDSENDWKYTKYWDTDGLDENGNNMLHDYETVDHLTDYPLLYDMTVVHPIIFHFGWEADSFLESDFADVIPASVYDIEINGTSKNVVINWDKHTVYVRMRYMLKAFDGEESDNYFGEWSDVASYGKDGMNPYTYYETGDIPAPFLYSYDPYITSDDNNKNYFTFKLKNDEEIRKIESDVARRYGGCQLEAEIRKGDNQMWCVVPLNKTYLTSSYISVELNNLFKNVPADSIETFQMRLRYKCVQLSSAEDGNELVSEIYSPYSKVFTFNKEPDKPVLGDVDGNGAINPVDATLALRQYTTAASGEGSAISEPEHLRADVNGDGVVNPVDATFILSYYTSVAAGGEEMPIEQFLKK